MDLELWILKLVYRTHCQKRSSKQRKTFHGNADRNKPINCSHMCSMQNKKPQNLLIWNHLQLEVPEILDTDLNLNRGKLFIEMHLLLLLERSALPKEYNSGLLLCQNLWYMREKCDKDKGDLNWEHPLPRV